MRVQVYLQQITPFATVELAQPVKYFPCKHEDHSLNPRAYKKKQQAMVKHTCNPSSRKVETYKSLRLAGQPTLSDLELHACTDTQTHTEITFPGYKNRQKSRQKSSMLLLEGWSQRHSPMRACIWPKGYRTIQRFLR